MLALGEGHLVSGFSHYHSTRYLMLYLWWSCATPWECLNAFPAKVQRRDGVQRTPPKSCTAQPGICSGRTLGVGSALHRYHWWSGRYPNSWSLYSYSKVSQCTGEIRKAGKGFPSLESSQKLLGMRSLRLTVQLKCFVKGALFLKEKNQTATELQIFWLNSKISADGLK